MAFLEEKGLERLWGYVIKKINAIPQANWTQSDKTASDYIKNRTHYVKNTEEIGDMIEVTVTGFEEWDGTYSSSINVEIPEASQFIYTFKVVWDGTEYLCERIPESVVPFVMRATLTLGNQGIFGEGEDTGEPFLIRVDEYNGSISVVTTDAGTQHTIKMVAIYEDVKPLSGKYIPYEIARTTDVENLVFDMVGEYPVYTQIEEAVTAVKDDLLNGAGAAYDTLKELGDLIDDNTDAIDALEIVATSKADKSEVAALSTLVGDTPVATQISNAVAQKSAVQIITWGADD